MEKIFNLREDQITLKRQLRYHFYPGIAITLVYILISKYLVDLGYPGLTALLFVEVFVLAPIGMAHLARKGYRLNGKFSLQNVIAFTRKLSIAQYLKWTFIGILGCTLIYVPLYPLGLFLKDNVFKWLPQWYFDPGFGTSDMDLIAKVFLLGIFIDGIIGPVVEELFFRGYLLPRMTYLKKWAPVVNGTLFGLYHFWQPHNYLAIIGVGIVISFVVWKKKNVYLGIAIHCTLNILGALAGYLAASGGELIVR
ncbi:CPBP family intramembrane glutamic endopeptidase [Ulvibacterium marinum]|uniref:CPBP family intramembrane metalloprotease n=1 Tax=Ulvibacterium marinum TaxID=2419782 RepID=A0A3B0C6C0_9FLAO|nr:CPBP family intramembrane glutamic endopeptidase [Ulvibacterium marinum]RKN79754.1 CPBP family intramembrane metalloprotease [Ulvibacterium marinum]